MKPGVAVIPMGFPHPGLFVVCPLRGRMWVDAPGERVKTVALWVSVAHPEDKVYVPCPPFLRTARRAEKGEGRWLLSCGLRSLTLP